MAVVAVLAGTALTASPATGATATTGIPLGTQGYGVAVDTARYYVYTANSNNTLSVIRPGISVQQVPARNGAYAVAVDDMTGTVYVANRYDNSVSVFNHGPSGVTETARIPVGLQPYGVAVDSISHTVYVANLNSKTVSVINGTTNAVTHTIPVTGGPWAVAVDSSVHTAFVATSHPQNPSTDGGSLRVITQTANGPAVTDSVQVGIRPRGVAVDTNTHSAYVASEGSNWADEIGMTSPGQYTAVRRLYGVSWGPGSSSVAVDWRTHAVYFGEVIGQRVTLVYGRGPLGQTLKETIPMGAAVYGVGVDFSDHRAFATKGGVLQVIQPTPTSVSVAAVPNGAIVNGVTPVVLTANVSPLTAGGSVQFVAVRGPAWYTNLGDPVPVVAGVAAKLTTLPSFTSRVIANFTPTYPAITGYSDGSVNVSVT
jgi:YVTN family beta-propeller protein